MSFELNFQLLLMMADSWRNTAYAAAQDSPAELAPVSSEQSLVTTALLWPATFALPRCWYCEVAKGTPPTLTSHFYGLP